jgi:multicomponent Na+:H+ antiporter subunit G
MTELVAAGFVILGLGFFAAGGIGLLRLPDLHSRLHALTKADNLGLGLLAAGLALHDGGVLTALKLLLVWLLVLAASATSAHLIAQQALRRERPPAPGAPETGEGNRADSLGHPLLRTAPARRGEQDGAAFGRNARA